MKKLEQSSKQFHDILYYIWKLLLYYADLFGYDTPEAAHKLHVNLFYDKTLTKIRVSVPRIKELNTLYSVEEMRTMMNEALEILLQGSTLPPFAAGSSYYEIVESLYITILVASDSWYDMDFLYIDNMDAYRTVKENRVENLLRII